MSSTPPRKNSLDTVKEHVAKYYNVVRWASIISLIVAIVMGIVWMKYSSNAMDVDNEIVRCKNPSVAASCKVDDLKKQSVELNKKSSDFKKSFLAFFFTFMLLQLLLSLVDSKNPVIDFVKGKWTNLWSHESAHDAMHNFHNNLINFKVVFLLVVIIAAILDEVSYTDISAKHSILRTKTFVVECIIVGLSVMLPTMQLTVMRDKQWFSDWNSESWLKDYPDLPETAPMKDKVMNWINRFGIKYRPLKKALILGVVFGTLNVLFEKAGLYAPYYETQNEVRVGHEKIVKLYDLVKDRADVQPEIKALVLKLRDLQQEESPKAITDKINEYVDAIDNTSATPAIRAVSLKNPETLKFIQAIIVPDESAIESTPVTRAASNMKNAVLVLVVIIIIGVLVNMLGSMVKARDMSTDYNSLFGINFQKHKALSFVAEANIFAVLAAVPLFVIAKNRGAVVSKHVVQEFGLFTGKFLLVFLGLQLSGTLAEWFGSHDANEEAIDKFNDSAFQTPGLAIPDDIKSFKRTDMLAGGIIVLEILLLFVGMIAWMKNTTTQTH